ncbi:hypothetical protein Dfer_0951 [Dyadobacter fermentans DSM 18053]|uniref:Uncharacterized protein n=1 Tax=Dyadobacter fermentans (strain ATCC 700827 / DSM 18053 / CIP 107007 / KCTC 52180 / NS114) TaxID=471854 RepID=C6W399_DYAFD|nr:hypothetical protein Dfer_0951 [Dyadobacter fermentans DSM 18053]
MCLCRDKVVEYHHVNESVVESNPKEQTSNPITI